VLNGRRVYVRQLELAPIAVDGEASKKMVSIIFYGNHNYNKLTSLPESLGGVVARKTI